MSIRDNDRHGAGNPGADQAAGLSGPACGIDTAALLARGRRYLVGNYRQAPVVLARGRGCEVFDTDGRRYLDMCAGVAVCSLGHGHPRLARAIAEQAATLVHTSNYFFNDQNVLLAEELCRATGFDRAMFSNSGAEANEAMLKLARRHFFTTGEPHRTRFVAFHGSFHGRTMGAVSLTGAPKYHEGFAPLVPGITHVAYGDLDAVRAAMSAEVAGIFVEPVQGEGGVLPAPAGFLAGLRKIADETGALLLCDEVQTGIGRTGRMLGLEHDGVQADAIALAKGLAGGFPIGALLIRERLNAAFAPGSHGSTFGGNPLASVAARTVLEVLEEDGLIESAALRGQRLSAGLTALVARHPDVCEGERGRGLLRGLALLPGVDARERLTRAREAGLLLTIAGANVLRWSPPLVVTDAEIDEALAKLDEALDERAPT